MARSGRGYILAVAILQFIASAVFLFLSGNMVDPEIASAMHTVAVVMSVVGFIYIGLWIWAKSAPFPAALTALIIYLTLIAADAAIDPSQIFRGIIIKVIIILGLAKAVQSGYALKNSTQI